MDKEKLLSEEYRRRVIVPDFHGNPTHIPEYMMESFLKDQEELREREARGEEIKTPDWIVQELLAMDEADMKELGVSFKE